MADLTPVNTAEHRIMPGFNISPRPLAHLRAPTRRFVRGAAPSDQDSLRAYPTQSDPQIDHVQIVHAAKTLARSVPER